RRIGKYFLRRLTSSSASSRMAPAGPSGIELVAGMCAGSGDSVNLGGLVKETARGLQPFDGQQSRLVRVTGARHETRAARVKWTALWTAVGMRYGPGDRRQLGPWLGMDARDRLQQQLGIRMFRGVEQVLD